MPETQEKRNDPDWDVLFKGVDLTSSVELRAAYGREKATIPGTRLSADRAFLIRLLAANPEHWLVVGLRLHRRGSRYSSDDDESSSYVPPYVRYYLIEEDGIARTLKRSD